MAAPVENICFDAKKPNILSVGCLLIKASSVKASALKTFQVLGFNYCTSRSSVQVTFLNPESERFVSSPCVLLLTS